MAERQVKKKSLNVSICKGLDGDMELRFCDFFFTKAK